ncbi:MAG TPA: pilus assembly protein TadE, partial [Herbaspirillum sp.]|nr:pilus assembly protein TadE [Herbaspirillum sp.]
ATTLSPVGVNDKPAVMVSLSKTSGKNGGPVRTLITAMFGGAAASIAVNAVAVISSPGNVLPGNLIPQVIDKCMFNLYWNSATNSPVTYTGTPADPFGISTVGQPWELRIGSAYQYGTCSSGMWTTFNLDANSQTAVKGLITNGNPTSLAIGDNTWVEPGVKTASFNDLNTQYPTLPVNVTVVVVDMPTLPTSGGGVATPIVAFAGFRIDAIQGGSGKYIQGHFISGVTTAGSGGIGPSYGAYTPPRLAQ